MKRFNRLLSIFLAVLMLSGVLTTTASALSFDFDSGSVVTRPSPATTPPATEEEHSVVRLYVQSTGTKGYTYTGTIPDNLTALWVKEGYLLIQPGVSFAGIKPKDIDSNNTVNADTVKKIKESITLPTVSEVVAAVNNKRAAEQLPNWDSADYSAVAVDSIMWENSDSAYHVHLTLVKKGDLVITANSYSVTYDGNVHAANGYTLTGTLKEGHKVQNVVLSGSGVNVGNYPLTPSSAKIVDGNGVDVTAQYKIAYVNGTLTINRCAITITAGSNSWPYDGNWHSDNYWHITAGTLATTDQIAVTVTGSIRDVGSTPNVPSNAVITNTSSRANVTGNYTISYVNGTLTITGKQYTPNPEYVDDYITIYKVDGSNRALSGAKFTLYNGSSAIYTTSATDSWGETTISTKDIAKYLPTTGSVTFTLRETQAPSGYTYDSRNYWNVTVSVSENDRNNNNGTFTKVYTYNMTVNNSGSLTVVNNKTQAPKTASFTIYKQDSAYPYNALKGATFYLYDENYNTRYTSKLVASATSDSNGRVTFTGLAEGTYYLVEYAAPSGYTKDSTVYRINVRVPSGSDSNQLVAFIAAENSISSRSITEADGYVIYNDRQQVIADTTSFTIIKRDSAWPYDALSGAWFDLYDSSYARSGKYDTKAKPIDSQKTDKYGEATFSKLAVGTYYLVEYSAPSGYTKDNTVYRITVRYPSGGNGKLVAFITKDNAISDRSLTEAHNYVIYNTKTVSGHGSVTVSKEVSGIGTSSRTKYNFEIWEKNGKKALKSFSLTAGESTTINLDPGSYIIKELDASKAGYELKTYIDGSLSRTGRTSFTVKAGAKTKIAYKNVYAAAIDLNTQDHYAYIIGYEDGTVRPDGYLTRAEVTTIFFRMLTDDARSRYWCTTNNYSDVSSSDWFNNAVSTLSYAGIINGYADGTFQPKGTITRAELVKMAMGFFNYTTGSSSSRFTDVGDHWAASYINKAAELGYLDIFGSTFEPNRPITRAEAITIINRVLGRNPHKDYMNIRQTYWSDNPTSAWYYADIQEATNSHDYTWINIYGNQYEEWTSALENRDWAALEKQWSTTYSSHNPGNVW